MEVKIKTKIDVPSHFHRSGHDKNKIICIHKMVEIMFKIVGKTGNEVAMLGIVKNDS